MYKSCNVEIDQYPKLPLVARSYHFDDQVSRQQLSAPVISYMYTISFFICMDI